MANTPFKRGDIVKYRETPGAIAIVVEPNEPRWSGCVGINWISGSKSVWRQQHPEYDFAASPHALTLLTETLDD